MHQPTSIRLVTLLLLGLTSPLAARDRGPGQEQPVETVSLLRQLKGPKSQVLHLAFSPDGSCLAAGGSRERAIYLWDVHTGKQLLQLMGPAGSEVPRVGFADAGKTLLSESGDGVLRSWNTGTGKLQRQLELSSRRYASSVGFSPDGKLFLRPTREYDAHGLWGVATGKELRRFPDPVLQCGWGGCAFSAGSKRVALIDPSGLVRVFNTANGAEISKFRHPSPVHPFVAMALVAFSPDGKTVGTAGHFDNALRLWDVATGKQLRAFTATRDVSAFTFSPDRRTLAVASHLDGLIVCDVLRGTTLRRLDPPPDFRNRDTYLAFSPDGSLLAVGSLGGVFLYQVTAVNLAALPKELSPEKLEALWLDLRSSEAACGERSVVTLAARPRQALPFLAKRLHAVPVAEELRLRRLLRELDDDQFAVREKATEELEKLVWMFEPALRQALAAGPGPEVKQRLTRVLKKLTRSAPPELTASLRAVDVLGRVGTPEARKVLEILVQGASSARLTQEAGSALARLKEPG